MSGIVCRHCGLPWPGDDALTTDVLITRVMPSMPICPFASPGGRWFVDSGINGHVFDDTMKRPAISWADGGEG